jgi:hypothetical protein
VALRDQVVFTKCVEMNFSEVHIHSGRHTQAALSFSGLMTKLGFPLLSYVYYSVLR